MKKSSSIIKILIASAYLILIGLLVFNVFALPDKYNSEEMVMVTEVEKEIREALDHTDDATRVELLDEARLEHRFDIVVTRGEEIVYHSIPYEIGDPLLERSHVDTVARESQGNFKYGDDEVFVWYAIYRLSDSVFINAFFKGLSMIVAIISILIALTVYLMFKTLFDPLKSIKESIEHAQDYEFSLIEEKDDGINREFKTFVSGLESNIDAVSRKHTLLEQQLQAKREHLNNIVVVSRSMIHDLKTPVHQNILENERASKDDPHNEGLIILSNKNQARNHNVLLEINRILKMLKDDSENFELKIEEVEVVATVMRAIKRFDREIFDKDLQLDFAAPQSLMLNTEESTLILLINNLLSNMVLYSKTDTELLVDIIEENEKITFRFENESTEQNIKRMNETNQLFNTVKDPAEDGYIYRSGNGLYLIKELARLLEASYALKTEGTRVIIEVVFDA